VTIGIATSNSRTTEFRADIFRDSTGDLGVLLESEVTVQPHASRRFGVVIQSNNMRAFDSTTTAVGASIRTWAMFRGGFHGGFSWWIIFLNCLIHQHFIFDKLI
jgi:hypothetical protein